MRYRLHLLPPEHSIRLPTVGFIAPLLLAACSGAYDIAFGNLGTQLCLRPEDVADHNLVDDPRLVDSVKGDFHVLPGSPAIGTGTAAPMSPTDFDGVSRPQGAGPDIRAFER